MKSRNNSLKAGILAGLIGASAAYGSLAVTQQLSALTQAADLIVLASPSGPQAGSTANFTLNVVRVIKGSQATVGTSLAVQWTASASPSSFQPVSGVWFLQRYPGGWSLLPVIQGAAVTFEKTYFPAPIAELPAFYGYPGAAPLQDKIASELGAAIESVSGYNTQLYGLFDGDLAQLGSPVVQVLYGRLSASASLPKQMLGMSGLLRSGNPSALASAVASAPAWATLFNTPTIEYGKVITALRNEFRSSDPVSVAALGQAATDSADPNLSFRVAAAHALASIHNTAALPYLASLLDDPDSQLRVEAVGGLGAFALGMPIQTSAQAASLSFMQTPADAPYRTPETIANFAMGAATIQGKESAYLAFWKNWWTRNRAALGF